MALIPQPLNFDGAISNNTLQMSACCFHRYFYLASGDL